MPTQLGRYTLEKKIGAGGMADVWLAHGPNGVCVLKCPHPHLCGNPEFVRMFLDEASILAQLHHPGIAQIYDLGHVSNAYYLAMEYVPGFDLMSISLEQERNGELMSPELCARIVADAAGALHYAHEAKDKNGRALNIVHRDVTPHNILLSRQGVVKLIDFGVAKASSTMHRTQAGFVKGKYPYMSPEQITGQVIDRRVDVYALGLVLYELLTNVRAIPGNTEIEQIDAARAGKIRPIEQLRPNIPVPLRQILGACLLHEVEGRYPTALALKEDLEKFLTLERQVLGQEDLLRLFRVVAADSGDTSFEGRPTEHEQPVSGNGPVVLPDSTLSPQKVDELGYSSTMPSMKVPAIPASATPLPLTAPVKVNSKPNAVGAPISLSQAPAASSHPTGMLVAPVSRTPLYVLIGLSTLVIGLVLALWKPWESPQPTRPIDPVPVAVVDAGTNEIAGKIDTFEFPAEDAGAVVAAEAPDAGVPVQAVVEVVDAGAQTPVFVAPKPTGTAHVSLTAETEASVIIDGRKVGSTPVELDLPVGTHFVVLKSGSVEKKLSWKLKAGETRSFALPAPSAVEPPQPPVVAASVAVRIEANPFCTMKIDGRQIGEGISFKELQLAVGSHSIECALVDPSLPAPRIKRQTVTLVDGRPASVKFDMMTP
jgi:serine/threonine-protein kinase